MVKRIRNKGCMPYVSTEGAIIKPFECPSPKRGGSWYSNLTPFDRCHAHQTLASVRRSAKFKPFSDLIPKDSLDFLLNSNYNHSKEPFPDKVDPCLQLETLGINTWRRLRNSRDLPPERDAKGSDVSFEFMSEAGFASARYNNSHPVLISGIKEREHPSHVKLMNSSNHSPQTNAGYTRQESYGTFFQY